MNNANLARRLDRLEAALVPPIYEPALTITVSRIGQSDKIIELYGIVPIKQRRRPWPRSSGRDR